MRLKSFLILLPFFLFYSVNCLSEKQYTNPVVFPSNYGMNSSADPFVFKDDDGKYYMYVTGAGYPCFSSSDLVNWKYEKNVFKKATAKWGKDRFWAPEMVKLGNTYYLNYTAGDASGILRIGMAKSNSPLGPFQDVANEPFYKHAEDRACIDSHIFFDDDGKVYMYYANDVSTNPSNRSEVWVIELEADLSGTIGTAKLLFYPTQAWEKKTSGKFWNEGPYMLKHNGKYYLMYSGNLYSTGNYAIGYATSNSPTGPFTKYAKNPILSQTSSVSGPGHNSVAASPDNTELYCVYHTHIDLVKKGGERMANIDKMGFTEEGVLYINGPTKTPQNYPSSGSPSGSNNPTTRPEIAIQPNIAMNHIEVESFSGIKNLNIFNTNGKLIYSSVADTYDNRNTIQVPIFTFPAGIYFVQVEDKKNKLFNAKFLKI